MHLRRRHEPNGRRTLQSQLVDGSNRSRVDRSAFLDHHIQCGNSLLEHHASIASRCGVPDDAFKPIEGDVKRIGVTDLKRRNQARTRGSRLRANETLI